MRVYVIGSDVPFRTHSRKGVTAVNIVLYELLRGLRSAGHEIGLQILYHFSRTGVDLDPEETDEIEHLHTLGIEVLIPVLLAPYAPHEQSVSRGRRLGRLIWRSIAGGKIETFYPSFFARETVRRTIEAYGADVVLTIWSPEGVAATHGIGVPRVAYQGDIDFIPEEVRVRNQALFFNSAPEAGLRQKMRVFMSLARLREFKSAHVRLMREVDTIANVTASNAEFYRNRGHLRSIYIQNTWSDLKVESDDRQSTHTSCQPVKIIGQAGYLGQTGSTFGLRFLLMELMPRLERAMDGLAYEVHVIGGGEVPAALKPWIEHDRVIMRGYVLDLDSELRSSDVFLFLNNTGAYRAAYTRHVVAWAMGLCLVAHANSKQAIPEIAHEENALIGSTPDEIARMVYLAATDSELNARIRKGGRETYERYFAPARVADRLSQEMLGLVGAR